MSSDPLADRIADALEPYLDDGFRVDVIAKLVTEAVRSSPEWQARVQPSGTGEKMHILDLFADDTEGQQ